MVPDSLGLEVPFLSSQRLKRYRQAWQKGNATLNVDGREKLKYRPKFDRPHVYDKGINGNRSDSAHLDSTERFLVRQRIYRPLGDTLNDSFLENEWPVSGRRDLQLSRPEADAHSSAVTDQLLELRDSALPEAMTDPTLEPL